MNYGCCFFFRPKEKHALRRFVCFSDEEVKELPKKLENDKMKNDQLILEILVLTLDDILLNI